MALDGRIDTWRTRVPSRQDREDPFEGDGFESRPATRLASLPCVLASPMLTSPRQTFREPDPPISRPSTRLSFLRAATPLFGRSSTPFSRPSTALRINRRRRGLLGLFGRKRKYTESTPSPEPIPREPVKLNFLFVGSGSSGQTSLLFRARYGYFPDDTSGVPDLNTVERLTYITWDAVFLCFDISDKVSMYAIVQWWHHASSHGFAQSATCQPLLYLLGLKKDLRDQCFLEDHREGVAHSTSGLLAYPTCCVCSTEASWHAKRIGAHRYLECSAATGEGIEAMFDEAGQEATGRIVGTEEVEAVQKKRRRQQLGMSATQPGSGLAILAGFIAAVFGLGVTTLLAFPSWTAIIRTYLLLLISFVIFVSNRHVQIVRRRSAGQKPRAKHSRQVDYNLFVLGSGGHTKEMLMMMDDGFCEFQNFHRRYLISSNDRMSENHLEDYETELRALCDARGQLPGTYDKCTVTRARRVHQPLWSTPVTALLSILDIFPVLLSPPANEAGAQLRYPTKIFSNGPATGFFVGVAVHLLKMFYVVPEDAMMFVYIESWARISTLSLTGKLFFYTGLADTFLVQHKEVAARYGIPNAGEMVFNSRRPEI
ncbi:hypothetical protein AK830_g999 [Neonectria ditissima]|uniref:UDP-N-acetylglucosamine transferase subunit ALG14 n=1 Tax=Neonectria ditissima TaxID=78410 RepID=A0A0P7B6U0_9HYPO|nr:hypothetical protein AK830_g999 [Neonectria ditissima]